MGISMLTNGPVTGSTANGASSRMSCRQEENNPLSQQATNKQCEIIRFLIAEGQKIDDGGKYRTTVRSPTLEDHLKNHGNANETQDLTSSLVTEDQANGSAIDSLAVEETAKEEISEIVGEEPLNLTQNFYSESRRIDQQQQKNEQKKDFLTTQQSPKEIQEQVVTTSENAVQNSDPKQMSIDDTKEGCESAAKRLSQVLKWINNQGRKDVLLKDFAHSASCKKESCSHLCLMFRRVRRHVVGARHACKVLMLYSILLRLHVSSCNDSDCGLPACPALKATRPGKRSLENGMSSPKRTARQVANGSLASSRAVFEPRSPGGSLPGSQVNSPPSSPEARDFDQCFPLNSESVQYMIVPVLPVVMLPSGKRVA